MDQLNLLTLEQKEHYQNFQNCPPGIRNRKMKFFLPILKRKKLINFIQTDDNGFKKFIYF